MRSNRLTVVIAVVFCFAFSLSAADKKKDAKADDSAKPSYEMPQPAVENLDLTMYQRIREEGLEHSHIMEYASGLADGIGPRLTGSPNLHKANEWTRDQFTAMGCTNAHLEDWGEFGMGWRQLNTWLRMSATPPYSSPRPCRGRHRVMARSAGRRYGSMRKMRKIWRSTKGSWPVRSFSSARCAR